MKYSPTSINQETLIQKIQRLDVELAKSKADRKAGYPLKEHHTPVRPPNVFTKYEPQNLLGDDSNWLPLWEKAKAQIESSSPTFMEGDRLLLNADPITIKEARTNKTPTWGVVIQVHDKWGLQQTVPCLDKNNKAIRVSFI